MLKFNPELRLILNSAVSKQDWSTKLKTALGTTRVLRCFRDASSTSIDPFITGIEFLNVSMSGNLSISAGAITGFGSTSHFNIHDAVDLSTGKACLRIEGNGNWIQGSLGLNTTTDFAFTDNPTGATGVAFSKASSVAPYVLLPSGTGPAAPTDDYDKPVGMRVIDWINPSSPVVVGTAYASVRDRDMVMDHPYLASEMGDVKISRMPDGGGVVFGTGGDAFRFAMTVYSMHGGVNNEVSGKPVHEVLIGAVPHNRWANFPYRGNLNLTTDTTAPSPFKIELLRADGTILHVFEMYGTRDSNNMPGSGQAINAITVLRKETTAGAVDPNWNCNMQLAYRSNRTKPNTKRNHLVPPVGATALHPSNVPNHTNGFNYWPPIGGSTQLNGMTMWRISPKWARGPQSDTLGFDTVLLDPYMDAVQRRRDGYIGQMIGWGYQPGAVGQHTWYMAPGGARYDRACLPHVTLLWNSTPDGIRPHGNVPYADLMEHWCLNYANEAMHFHTNLERGITLAKKNVLGIDRVCYNDAYYSGGNEDYVPDIPNHAIRMLVSRRGEGINTYIDKNGRLFNTDYARDNQHNYDNAAQFCWLKNSAIGAILGKHSFDANVLCNWEFTNTILPFNPSQFLSREFAWFNWHFANMWMISSNDIRSLTRDEVEIMWQTFLERVYDSVYPRFANPNVPGDYYAKLLNVTGMSAQQSGVSGSNVTFSLYDSKAFYSGQWLMFSKQSGAWDAMRSRSVKCAATLDMILTCLARGSVDQYMDANGVVDRSDTNVGGPAVTWNFQNYSVPLTTPITSWADLYPANNGMTWVRYSNGSLDTNADQNITSHQRAQFPFILRDFFPERNYPRVAAACSKVDVWYAEYEAAYQATKTNAFPTQWGFRYANNGIFNAPNIIGSI